MTSTADSQPWRIEWRDGLSVSNTRIDDHHKELIARVNDLNSGLVAQAGQEKVLQLMQRLLDVVGTHFAAEEVMLRDCNYPGLDSHVAAHARLTAEFRGAMDNFARSPVSLTWLAKGLLISRALMEHLAKDDMLYRDFMASPPA